MLLLNCGGTWGEQGLPVHFVGQNSECGKSRQLLSHMPLTSIQELNTYKSKGRNYLNQIPQLK